MNDAESGCWTASVHEPLGALMSRAWAAGVHLGFLDAPYATLDEAFRHGDPALLVRVQWADLYGQDGELRLPRAPRAAMGPDLSALLVGRHASIGQLGLRVDRVVSWGQSAPMPWREACTLGQKLAERGCSLVGLRRTEGESWRVSTAFPRHTLARLLPPSEAGAAPRTCRALWNMEASWWDAPHVMEGLRPLHEEITLDALDSRRVCIRVVAPHAKPLPLATWRKLWSMRRGDASALPVDLRAALKFASQHAGGRHA